MVKLHPDISSPVFADLNRYFAPKHDVFPSLTRWVIYSEDWAGMRHCKKDNFISINPQCNLLTITLWSGASKQMYHTCGCNITTSMYTVCALLTHTSILFQKMNGSRFAFIHKPNIAIRRWNSHL